MVDTLNKIALKNSVTVEELIISNPSIVNANVIFIGNELKIPNSIENCRLKKIH